MIIVAMIICAVMLFVCAISGMSIADKEYARKHRRNPYAPFEKDCESNLPLVLLGNAVVYAFLFGLLSKCP